MPSSGEREETPIAKARATINGVDLNLDDYARDWARETCDENLQTFPSGALTEGVYQREAKAERVFDEGELIFNDMGVAKVELLVNFSVRVIRPPVVSHFDVATRGRSISWAPVEIGNDTLRAGIVVLTTERPTGHR